MIDLVVKIGGAPAENRDLVVSLMRELRGRSAVLVHGGGAHLTALSNRLGLTVEFVDGVRVTPPDAMDAADMILGGLVNTRLVRLAEAAGVPAVGLTGADGHLLVADAVSEHNRTAVAPRVNPDPLTALLTAHYLPVVASVAADGDGGAVNVNADTAARAIAERAGADALAFVSDVSGVLGPEKALIRDLPVAGIEPLIGAGVVVGGMAAKLRAAAEAVAAGVARVVIGTYRVPGDLTALLEGKEGTTIHAD